MLLTSSFSADLLLFAILGLIAWHTYFLHRKKRWLVFDPLNTFWAGILIVYVMQPILHERQLNEWHSPGVFEKTLLWTFIGLACVVAGYESSFGLRWCRYIPATPSRIPFPWLAGLGLIGVALGIAGYLILFEAAGGAEAWLSVGRGKAIVGISGYLAMLEHFLPIGLLLLLLAVEVYRKECPQLGRVAIWTLAILLWLWLFYLGTRSRIIGWTLAIMAIYYLTRRKNPPLWLAGLVFVALLLITNFQGRYRGQFTNLSLHLDQIEWGEMEREVLPHFGSKAHDNKITTKGVECNCAMTVIEYAGMQIPFNYGYGHLEIFTRPIPRSYWPNKPYPLMESYQDALRIGNLSLCYLPGQNLLAGPSFTFVGHWYLVGGPLALMAAGYLTGSMFRMFRQVYERVPLSHGDLLLYLNLFPLGFFEAAGEPLTFVYSLTSQVLLLLPLFWLHRTNKQPMMQFGVSSGR